MPLPRSPVPLRSPDSGSVTSHCPVTLPYGSGSLCLAQDIIDAIIDWQIEEDLALQQALLLDARKTGLSAPSPQPWSASPSGEGSTTTTATVISALIQAKLEYARDMEEPQAGSTAGQMAKDPVNSAQSPADPKPKDKAKNNKLADTAKQLGSKNKNKPSTKALARDVSEISLRRRTTPLSSDTPNVSSHFPPPPTYEQIYPIGLYPVPVFESLPVVESRANPFFIVATYLLMKAHIRHSGKGYPPQMISPEEMIQSSLLPESSGTDCSVLPRSTDAVIGTAYLLGGQVFYDVAHWGCTVNDMLQDLQRETKIWGLEQLDPPERQTLVDGLKNLKTFKLPRPTPAEIGPMHPTLAVQKLQDQVKARESYTTLATACTPGRRVQRRRLFWPCNVAQDC
ncbi:hypothetical protein C8F01DRAFT_1347721 [Mycena amicta]|nr:hypothetical protein C8F01DRAFT_1347721 [Mycena amicta]